MNEQTATHAMIEFLKNRIIEDPSTEILADTPLVSSGLVDSFALVEVLLQLERVTKLAISPSMVSPDDLDTVARMLATATRIGEPR
jgi:acyl carrier protein